MRGLTPCVPSPSTKTGPAFAFAAKNSSNPAELGLESFSTQSCSRLTLPAAPSGIGAPWKHKSIRAIRHSAIARACMFGGNPMQSVTQKLRPAQAEVHRTARDQDLIEIPKRARLDREAEGRKLEQAIPVSDNRQAAILCRENRPTC